MTTTPLFTATRPIDGPHKKGMDIDIVVPDAPNEVSTLNVWVDTMDTDEMAQLTLRATLNNGADSLILCTVENSDNRAPVVTYSDDKTYCYVTFDKHALHVKLEGEGLVLDVWETDAGGDGSIDTNYVLYQELPEYADYR
jgi:hypothetical protein